MFFHTGRSPHARKNSRANAPCGFSLIEVVVASALLLLVFSGLFAAMQLMINIITHTKAEAGAHALAVERMEYIRSLPYDDVGTISGIPEGAIAQDATSSLNGISYQVHTLIQYIDRPQDGTGASDDNSITADSKVVKIVISWNILGEIQSFTLTSDVIPPGIESTSGGGTLLIHVFDAGVQPVSGATVHVTNNTGTSTIDVTVTTNASGIANFPGAPARGGYHIVASKSGYSTDQTYSASSTNQNPNPPDVAVVVGGVSTVYLSIDQHSDMTIRSISTPVTDIFSDSFASNGLLQQETNTEVTGGDIVLSQTAGNYASNGSAIASTTMPAQIASWESLDFNGTTTASSSYAVHIYTASVSGTTTTYTLVPDSDLPGNTTGFTSGPVDLRSLATSSYPAIALGVSMHSSSTSQTPRLSDWGVTYIESETPVGNVTFNVQSSKTIGDNNGAPVYKYTNTVTTDSNGSVTIPDIEWDAYDISINGSVEGYDISETSDPIPFALDPGVSDSVTFVLAPHTQYSLRATVVDTQGDPVGGASVHLSNGSFDQTLETSVYGQVFFNSGVASGTDYTLEVSKSGFNTDTQSNISITDNTHMQVVLGTGGGGGSTGTTTPPSSPSNSYLSGYTTRIPLTISGTTLFGDVSNFPIYVDLSDLPSSFFSDVQGTGADIRVTQSDGLTQVPTELVWIDTSSHTGELYFKAPALITSTTTKFYIYYGSSTASAQGVADTYGRNNVWNNNFRAVYHLQNAQSGTGNSGVYIDSTGIGGAGTDNISATDKNGKLGLGQHFNGYSNDNIELPYSILNNQSDLTTTFWYRTNSSRYMSVLSGARNNTADGANEYLLWFKDHNDIEFFSQGDPRIDFSISNMDDNAWRYYSFVRDGTDNRAYLYINGVPDNQNPIGRTMVPLRIAPGGLFVGVDQDSVGGSFGQQLNGDLDELRIASGVRSNDWISNVYLNENSPTGFYSIGTEESM